MRPPCWTKIGKLKEDSSILAKGALGEDSSRKSESRPAIRRSPPLRGESLRVVYSFSKTPRTSLRAQPAGEPAQTPLPHVV